jgi:hypothetical protein
VLSSYPARRGLHGRWWSAATVPSRSSAIQEEALVWACKLYPVKRQQINALSLNKSSLRSGIKMLQPQAASFNNSATVTLQAY